MNPLLNAKRPVWWPVVLAGVLGMVMLGCDKKPSTGTVEGKVLLNDAPYTNAKVIFLDAKTGSAGSADIQPDGTFRMQAPLKVGKYTVFLTPKPGAPTEAKEQPTVIDKSVPEKYWNEATSGISVEITEGQNKVTVPLKK